MGVTIGLLTIGSVIRGSHPGPKIRGVPGLKKSFFRTLWPQFGLKIRGLWAPPWIRH